MSEILLTPDPPPEHHATGNGKSDYLLRKVIVFSLGAYVLMSGPLMTLLVATGKSIPPEMSLMASTAMGILGGIMSPNLRR